MQHFHADLFCFYFFVDVFSFVFVFRFYMTDFLFFTLYSHVLKMITVVVLKVVPTDIKPIKCIYLLLLSFAACLHIIIIQMT